MVLHADYVLIKRALIKWTRQPTASALDHFDLLIQVDSIVREIALVLHQSMLLHGFYLLGLAQWLR
jgi:hypothetical protein